MADTEQPALLQNQAIILQQPNGEKIYLDLNVSTDTTAIKSFEKSADISIASFDYATGIALFLGLCATWLAYWYGRTSFKLTKQSFDAVIAQIKSSEQVALDLNQRLFEQQKELQNKDLAFKQKSEWENQLRAVSAEYQINLTMFIYKSQYFEKNLLSSQSEERNNFYNEITIISEHAIKHLVRLDLFFDPNDDDLDQIIYWSDIFSIISNDLLIEYQTQNDLNKLEKFIPFAESSPYFSEEEKLILKGKYRIEVLSFLMRRINDSLKSILNKKAA